MYVYATFLPTQVWCSADLLTRVLTEIPEVLFIIVITLALVTWWKLKNCGSPQPKPAHYSPCEQLV